MAQKRDLFGIILIGFGKSLIFQLLPNLLNRVKELERVCDLVVTFLVSIMKDQVEELTRLGLRAFAIGLGDGKGEEAFDRVSLKDFHQSVIEPRLVFYIDQMNLPASPNVHCNGLLLLCKNEPHERLAQRLAQERQDNLGKFTPRCKQFPSSVAV